MTLASASAVVILALSGCGGEEADAPVVKTTEAETTTVRETRSRCQRAPSLVLRAIEQGLTVQGGGSLRNGWYVRSGDFERVYFVAADIEGPGMTGPDQVGLWTTNRVNEQRGAYAVNGFAQEFSDWGRSSQVGISQFDDGGIEALKCAGG